MMRAAAAILVLVFATATLAEDAVPIAEARKERAGAVVTVIGLVTIAPGSFQSSTNDLGFALQDQTGGIWISVQEPLSLRLDQKVRVTGVLGEANKKLQLVPKSASDIVALQGRDLTVATGHVNEHILGFLVTIEGIVTSEGLVADAPYGNKFFLDDGSGRAQVFLSSNIDPPRSLRAGQRVRVTGFASRYEDAFEVEARSLTMLTRAGARARRGRE